MTLQKADYLTTADRSLAPDWFPNLREAESLNSVQLTNTDDSHAESTQK